MKRSLVILIAVLLAASLACNAFGGKKTETPSETQAPSEAATPEKPVSGESGQVAATTQEEQAAGTTEEEQQSETTAEEQTSAGEEPESSEVGLEAINSYRSHKTWQVEYPDGSIEQVITDDEATRDPNAYHSTIQVNKPDSNETWETIRVGDTMWTRINDEWMQNQIDSVNFEDNQTILYFMDYSEYIKSGAFSDEGKDTVNGIKTRKYRATSFDQGDFALAWIYAIQSSYSMVGNITGVENVSDEYWIADEEDLPAFIVRHVQEGKGTDEGGQTLTFTDIFEVYDLNESITIEAPESLAGGWPPDDVPECDGGTVLSSVGMENGGMMSVSCPGGFDDVAAFYQQALGTAGWTQAETNKPTDTMLVDTWTKDDRSMSLMVSLDTENVCSVTIIIENQ